MAHNEKELASPLLRVKIELDEPEKVEQAIQVLYLKIQGSEITERQFTPYVDSNGKRLVLAVIHYIEKNPVI